MSTSRDRTASDRSAGPDRRDRPDSDGVARATARGRYPTPPWLANGLDVGPARVPIHVLAAWAFAVAGCDVADWPEGTRRVRAARRWVRDRLRGRRLRRTAVEDLEFTAALLARCFDAELHLCALDAIAILDAMGLPSDEVPVVVRRSSSIRVTRPAPTPPGTPVTALRRPQAIAAHVSELSIEPRFRNAA